MPNKGEDKPRQANGGEKAKPRPAKGGEGDLTRLSEVVGDQGSAASDQTASDADQTASDADQALSDAEGLLAGAEQVAADLDQSASDRDQAASDQELLEHPGLETAHRVHRAEREEGARVRKEAGQSRSHTAEERGRLAQRRDETAVERDLTARARDSAAAQRDKDSAKIERKIGSRGSSLRIALAHAADVRAQAARDRTRAAEDRELAAADRNRAAEERTVTLDELKQAHRDDLTGAFRRGVGEEALQDEIDRARREGLALVLAFVDVDGLREVNNRLGHPTGDELLRDVVSAIRTKIRSYEPIVRFGGDEFVCIVGGVDLDQVTERFTDVKKTLAAANNGRAVSFGLAELQEDDTLADLVKRADAAMLDSRGGGD